MCSRDEYTGTCYAIEQRQVDKTDKEAELSARMRDLEKEYEAKLKKAGNELKKQTDNYQNLQTKSQEKEKELLKQKEIVCVSEFYTGGITFIRNQ